MAAPFYSTAEEAAYLFYYRVYARAQNAGPTGVRIAPGNCWNLLYGLSASFISAYVIKYTQREKRAGLNE
ncbi:hypothetical protein N7540_013009 [Penicillium herquei]|nr:hypothetical protein N7540_013009 [Penicillium herquei]